MALTLYEQPKSVIGDFNELHRTVDIGDTLHLRLRQDWSSTGVAGVVWQTAIVLAAHIVANAHTVSNRRVLELGAGTGLVSIAAVRAGARSVVATDVASTLPLLRANIDENVDADRRPHIRVEELDWSNAESQVHGDYDTVLGSDLVYDEQLFEPLKRTLLRYVTGSTHCLLAAKIRYDKDSRFFDLLQSDFHLSQVAHNDRDTSVVVYSLRRKHDEI